MGAELRNHRGTPPGLARVQADIQRTVDAGEIRLSKSRPGPTRPRRAGRGSRRSEYRQTTVQELWGATGTHTRERDTHRHDGNDFRVHASSHSVGGISPATVSTIQLILTPAKQTARGPTSVSTPAWGSPLKCESIAASPSWRCVSLPRVAVAIHRPPRPRRRRSLSTARGPALSPAMFQVYRLVRRPSRSRTLVRRCLVRGLRSTLIRRSIRLGLLVERRAECRLKERSHRPSLPSAHTPSTRR